MTKEESGKKYALIAAIIYVIEAVYSIVRFISNGNTINGSIVIYWISLIGLAVTLLIKNKRAIVWPVGTMILVAIYWLIGSVDLYELFFCFAYVALLVIIIMSIKGNTLTREIWFLAGTLLLIGDLILCMKYVYFSFSLVEFVPLFFAGMWLKEDVEPAEKIPVNELATFNSQAMHTTTTNPSAIGGADKLKMYKELLDSGAITQEEFDTKKKEILGL